jgi:hypothetical protein
LIVQPPPNDYSPTPNQKDIPNGGATVRRRLR